MSNTVNFVVDELNNNTVLYAQKECIAKIKYSKIIMYENSMRKIFFA